MCVCVSARVCLCLIYILFYLIGCDYSPIHYRIMLRVARNRSTNLITSDLKSSGECMPCLTCWNREICPQKFTPPTIILLLIIIGTYICVCMCVCVHFIYMYIYRDISEYRKSYIQFTLRSSLSLSGGLLTIIIKHVTRYVFFFLYGIYYRLINSVLVKKGAEIDARDGRSFLSSGKIRGKL